jgi:hypothetical protein
MNGMKFLQKMFVGTSAIAFPFVTHADGKWCAGSDCSFALFVEWAIGSIFRPVIPVIVSLTVAYFLWGTTQYIMYGDDPNKRSEGRKKMIWGIIGLSVMMSFWAFARMVKGTFF